MNLIETRGGALNEEAVYEIKRNIRKVFGCSDEAITDLRPMQRGLTNILLLFEIDNKTYVYRHPGAGSNLIVDRGREALMQKIAAELGIDNSVIALEAVEGWRISDYKENRILRYHDEEDMKQAMAILRTLHKLPCTYRWDFDPMWDAKRMRNNTPVLNYGQLPNFDRMREMCRDLYTFSKTDNIEKCYIQGDARDENFLICSDGMHLINWEYAGYGDPAFNIGMYIIGGDHSFEEVDVILREYFQREPTDIEKRHYLAYVAICAWWGLHWVMLKTAVGQTNHEIEEYTELWIRYTMEFGEAALKIYETE